MDKVGSSSDKGQTELAVAYSVASTRTDEFYAQNHNNFKTPEMVQHLPRRQPLTDGQKYVPEIVTSKTDYYDGTKSFRTSAGTSNCSSFNNAPRLCVKQENCGWCGASSACISGNGLGPRTPCKNNSFVYKAPADWKP